MNTAKSVILGAVLSAASALVNAGIISVDADGFAPGTILNNAFAGVTLSGVGTSTDGNVYARVSALATTGTNVFGNSSRFDPLWIPGGRELRIDFAAATRFVSIDLIADDATDVGSFEIFDAGSVSLGFKTTAALGAGDSETLSFTRTSADIAFAVATGNGDDNVALDNIRYERTVVPLPSTLALFGLGIAAAGMMGRRRR